MAFTIGEYVEQHGLKVNLKDPVAARMVHHHLVKLGYKRVRRPHNGKSAWVWVSLANSPDVERKELEEKLKEIENGKS
jgi:hypothetical protein